ncbi:MAG: redoxin domain-containing protein [Candidatus Saccharicenans sp.]|nr:redoxin domain-containing protein [Candidatus Saccharicenans sp.]
MKSGKIPVPLSIVLIASLFWGLNNWQKWQDCQRVNREMVAELKKATDSTSGRYGQTFLQEGDEFQESVSLRLLDDQTWVLQPGTRTVLIFISTGCPACLEMALRVFLDVQGFQHDGVQIVSVSRDLEEDLTEMVEQRNWPLPVVHDREGRLYRMFRVAAEPVVVFLDCRLVKLRIHPLEIDNRRAQLCEAIKQSLASSC